MPPPRKKSTKSSHKGYFAVLDPLLKELNISSLKKLIFSPSHAWIAAIVLLVVELCVNIVVIHKVNYTEIDWVAYMQEVEGVVARKCLPRYSFPVPSYVPKNQGWREREPLMRQKKDSKW